MRIFLNAEASAALNEIHEKIKTANEFASKSLSALASLILISEVKRLDAVRIAELAEGLVAPEQKKRALIRQLEKLADEAGLNSISQLEKSVKKLQREIAEKQENTA